MPLDSEYHCDVCGFVRSDNVHVVDHEFVQSSPDEPNDFDPVGFVIENQSVFRRAVTSLSLLRGGWKNDDARRQCARNFGEWLNTDKGGRLIHYLERLKRHYAKPADNPPDGRSGEQHVHSSDGEREVRPEGEGMYGRTQYCVHCAQANGLCLRSDCSAR